MGESTSKGREGRGEDLLIKEGREGGLPVRGTEGRRRDRQGIRHPKVQMSRKETAAV